MMMEFCHLEEAPSKCLNEHCEYAEVFKDRLMCVRHNRLFDLTTIEKGETDYHAKQDFGKAKLSLVPRRIIWDIAAIREYGNNKYPDGGPDNWKTVDVQRYRDALYRHFLNYLDNPYSVDDESGFPHLWHLACNIAFLCEMEDMYLSKNPKVVDKLRREFAFKFKEGKGQNEISWQPVVGRGEKWDVTPNGHITRKEEVEELPEQDCSNCKYGLPNACFEKCRGCTDESSNWEPATEVDE